ncbi:MAG: TonB-dependent receptor [Bacteroidales bacterium]|nr:TonB-dependent receptor [Bacteroidales bacterium]
MKTGLIFIQMLLLISLASAQNPEKRMSGQFNRVPFSDFIRSVSSQTGVKIFCQDSLLNDRMVNLKADSLTAIEAVRLAWSDSDIEISMWNGNLILLKGEKLLNSLPVYKSEIKVSSSADQKSKAITASEERYLTGRMADAIQTIRIGKAGTSKNGLKAKILGRILDIETGEPVFYATVYIPEIKTGAVSDVNGFYSIMLKPGRYNAVFEFLGYEKKKYMLDVLSDGNFTVNMKKAVITMEEFVVHGDRQMNIMAKDAGLEKISMKTIKELPMMMGERDILNVSGTLPGIVSAGEGSSGLNVRGGSSDQNAFYINKIPIYNTSHLFGFFPAFNSDIIKDFSIYKGHIPAQYGGRLSSVFNIITRQGNRKRFTAHGGVSPITGNLVIEGPLKKDTCSFLISARSSYSDWILAKIHDPDIRNSTAKFSDFSGGINYDIQKTQISVFVYHSKDRFRLSDINDFNYTNSGASLILSHNFTNSLYGELSVVGSEYFFSTTDKQELSNAYEHSYKIGHYEIRADFKHVLSNSNTMDYGISSVLYKLDRGTVIPWGSSSLHNIVALGKEKGLESALYISDSWDLAPRLNLTTGLRYAIYNPLGEKTVYTYAPGSPLDVRYINDTLNFGNNEAIRWYSEPDVRASLNYETDENGSLKLAYNQMHQNLFMLNNTITVAPNTQWKLADYHLLPSKSEQLSFGVFRIFNRLGLETSLEVYYKRAKNYPQFKDGADFLKSPLVETTVLQGDQKSYGVEFFLKRSNRKFDGWLSYTWSRTMVQVDGIQDWERINEGEVFPANYDIPHVLNLVMSYHLSRRVTFSSIVTYQTGKPITYPISVYYINGVPMLDYSKRNKYRIPDYFRTDLSMTIEGNLKKHKFLHSSFIFSVYNLSGRDNPYSVYFKNEDGRINSYQYSVIGVPIFTATWIFKLGNYASD